MLLPDASGVLCGSTTHQHASNQPDRITCPDCIKVALHAAIEFKELVTVVQRSIERLYKINDTLQEGRKRTQKLTAQIMRKAGYE